MAKSLFSRRDMLSATALVGTGVALAGCSESKAHTVATPAQTEGPFYPVVDQADKDADLTTVQGRENVADGEVISVQGRVIDEAGLPIANAVVDVWQANAVGRYAHEADTTTAPLDPNFQGWAILKTDAEGNYRFKTVKPGAYPANEGWMRPPHIHFKVSRRGYREITTQMYFESEPLNDVDKLLGEIPKDQRGLLIASRESVSAPFLFDLVLAKI